MVTVQNQSQPDLEQVQIALVQRGWLLVGQVREVGQESLVVEKPQGATTLTLTLTTARLETGAWESRLVLRACANLTESGGWQSRQDFLEWVVLRYGFQPNGVSERVFPTQTMTAHWQLNCQQAILSNGEVYPESVVEICQPFLDWTGIGDARCAYRSPAFLLG